MIQRTGWSLLQNGENDTSPNWYSPAKPGQDQDVTGCYSSSGVSGYKETQHERDGFVKMLYQLAIAA